MRLRALLALPFLCLALEAQDPGLKDSFLQAKALWASQGDRDGATSRLDAVVAALQPKAASLDPEWLQVLCESFNWLAVLDDRSPQNKARAQVRLQALLDLSPDFELDKAITSQRLAALHDRLRGEKYGLVKLTFSPEGGTLLVDGKPSPPLARKYLPFGARRLSYSRPGHTPAELTLELGPREPRTAEFKLTRVASTIKLYVHPSGAEVLLDGRSLGTAGGRAGTEAANLAIPMGMRPEDLSAAFLIPELPAGKHRLELRAACYRTKALELGADLATPFADHTLEPIRLAPSRGTLTVQSAWPGGELFLSGTSRGALPITDLPVCSGAYDLMVRFPAGGFSQRLTVEEGRSVALEARPKPRLAFLGLEGGEFTGRARFQALLEALGDRLQHLAFVGPRPGEAPKDALVRLKATREAELVLMAVPVPDRVIHRVELRLATLEGDEESSLVKPLEQDPLATLVARLNTLPPTAEPSLGLSLLDVPGEPGPWVAAASEGALKAGIQVGQPLTQVQGRPLARALQLRPALDGAKGSLAVAQGTTTLSLPVTQEALEVPLGAPELCYPALLAQLRLRHLGAKGDEANLLKLNMALVLMQLRKFDKAVELLRDARLSTTRGVSQGTLDYHTGVCFLHLGPAFQSEAAQAFRQALKYPQSTLLGPEGPLVAPLARQALEDLK